MNLIKSILTPRLTLRMLDVEDAADVQALLAKNRDYMLPWVPWAVDEPESVEYKKTKIRTWKGEFYLDQKYTYGVYEIKSQKLIGIVFLFTRQGKGILEIGYLIDLDEAGKGYATESSYAVTKLGFEHIGIEKMVIHCSPENIASQKVPEKLGFALEGSYKSAQKGPDGLRSETVIWAQFLEQFKPDLKFEPTNLNKETGWD